MNELNGYDIEDLEVGMCARFSKTMTDADIILFAGTSGDNNAIHISEAFAKTTPFGGRIAHGFLTASTISAAIATRLPGPGSVYISQSMTFLGPVRPGDTVEAVVTVKEVMRERCRAVLSTVCLVGETPVVEGEAVVKPTSRRRRGEAA